MLLFASLPSRKFMNASAEALALTNTLLSTIRLQRHLDIYNDVVNRPTKPNIADSETIFQSNSDRLVANIYIGQP